MIPIRHGWQNQTEKLVPGPERRGNIVHTEAGTVFCVGITSRPTVKHQMASVEYEADRGTLQWRCPGRHEGWECPLAAKGNAAKAYGLTVRVKRETDLRRFRPIPQATRKFEEFDKGRTAVERANARLKVCWGTDDENISGGHDSTGCSAP